jgi:hypothetical protein
MKKITLILIVLFWTAAGYAGEESKNHAASVLRAAPCRLTGEDVNAMVEKHHFFNRSIHKNNGVQHPFSDNGNGTVTDPAAGLMWQNSGHRAAVTYISAQALINRLNKEKFAGHSDWRLPTLEELASLMQSPRTDGLYLAPIWDHRPLCWSADAYPDAPISSWYAVFSDGTLSWASHPFTFFVRAVRSAPPLPETPQKP